MFCNDFVTSFIADYQTWKLTKGGKLVNKTVNANWKFGKNTWEIQQGGYIMSKATKRVLDSEGREFENEVRIWFKTGKSNQKWEAIPDRCGWIKLKNIKTGLFLHSSACGQKLSVETGGKGISLMSLVGHLELIYLDVSNFECLLFFPSGLPS